MATPPDGAPPAMDADPRRALVATLADRLRRLYVHADAGEAMAQALPRALDDPALPAWPDGHALAAALTTRLQAVRADAHLRVRWFAQPLPEPGADAAGPDAAQAEAAAAAEADHHGIHRVERLDGGIGLLELRQFHPPACSAASVSAAMTLLAPSPALIIDLRRCRGGEPDMVAFLSSYLFDETPVHLNSLYIRPEDRLQAYWTLAEVPGRRYGSRRPVLLLGSRQTFSAGEEFAYSLQARRRATVVGETTRGGAHAGEVHRLDAHYAVFIPDTRAVNPVTGGNWEGIGVSPDVPCAADEALAVAHRLALEQLARAAPDAD